MNTFRALICMKYISRKDLLASFFLLIFSAAIGQNPRVVRIQADACSTTEAQGEFFQFITGGQNYDLNKNTITLTSSIPPAGTSPVTINGFGPPANALINALNMKLGSCPKPVFINPFAPPYNGMIPPNAVVLAFVSTTAIADVIKVPASLCGRAPIFVIVSNTNLVSQFFNNKDLPVSCAFSCPQTLSFTFGAYNVQHVLDANLLPDNISGGFAEIDVKSNLIYKTSDGCIPFTLACDTPKIILPSSPVTSCLSVGDTLPTISDKFTGNAAYFTSQGRTGTKYLPGQVIFTSITLYASDFNNCDSAGSFTEKTYQINITPSPKIDDSIGGIVGPVCGYYLLPKITGQNLTGNQSYSFNPSGIHGGIISKGKSQDTLFTNRPNTLDTVLVYAIDQNFSTGCPEDRKELRVIFRPKPKIDRVADVSSGCGINYNLPFISGSNISAPSTVGYYTGSRGTGIKLASGAIVDSTRNIFIYASFDKCFDEDTFKVTLVKRPSLEVDTFRNDTFCDFYSLPATKYPIRYNTALNESGTGYKPGDKITTSTKLYYIAGDATCPKIDSLTLTQRKTVINAFDNVTVPSRLCNPYFVLPVINGLNLNKALYYEFPNGNGQSFKPGDTIKAFKPNYFYDNRTLYLYDSTQYHYQKCIATNKVDLNFRFVVDIFSPGDTTMLCGQPYTVPILEPENFFNPKYVYSGRGKTGIQYKTGDKINQPGTYYVYAESLGCSDQDSFKLDIKSGPVYSNNNDTISCDPVKLAPINGKFFNKDSTFYFTQSFGGGAKLAPGTTLGNSATLYIFDKSQKCIVQDTIDVKLNAKPNIIFPGLSINGCDSLKLPTVTGFPDLAYYTQSNKKGQTIFPGDYISKTSTLFAYTGAGTCFDEDTISAVIHITPTITAIRDTILCNDLKLPVINGKNNTGTQHYHDRPRDQGQTFFAGNTVSTSITLYAVDNNNGCLAEDTFNITILPRPVIDSIADPTVCGAYILPRPAGVNLSNVGYFDAPNGTGKSYHIGDSISKTLKLYIYQSSAACPAQRNVQITVKDSITSSFDLQPSITCANNTIQALHNGKKNSNTSFTWNITGPGVLPSLPNQSFQSFNLDTGKYNLTLKANAANACIGQSVSQDIKVVPKAAPLKNLSCVEGNDNILFTWDPSAYATDYKIDLLQGPTGVRSPFSMIFNGLADRQRVGIMVTPVGEAACANGISQSLTCAARKCDQYTVKIQDHSPFCSGDSPYNLVAIINGPVPPDTSGIKRVWIGNGIVRDTFFPSVAGPGIHTLRFFYTTKDSCTYVDSTKFQVGSGSVTILNTQSVECAPPSQKQFNIQMKVTTPNTPYNIYYSYSGGRSSIFPGSAMDFTLSASFGLIGDSITIDSILDSKGCKMQILSNAGTRTFKAVKYIQKIDTPQVVCDYRDQFYSYTVKVKNPNINDPLVVLQGGGSFRDSVYASPNLAFGTQHQVTLSHSFACDSLSYNVSGLQCNCTPVRDTLNITACETQTIFIHGKRFTVNKPSGLDTISPVDVSLCDTIRFISINFLKTKENIVRRTACYDDVLRFGGKLFDRNSPDGIIVLTGQASNGCDSVINVAIDFMDHIRITLRDTICFGDTLRKGGFVFHAGHTQDSTRFVGMASNGCDSIVYYKVQVDNIKATYSLESPGCGITAGRTILVSNVSGASSPFSYAFTNNFSASTTIQSFPLRISNFVGDSFNLYIRSRKGCIQSFPINFNAGANNTKINLGPDRTIKLGDTVHLQINLNPGIRFRWLTADYLSCTNCLNPVASPLKTTLYIIETKDASSCILRDTLRIFVDPDVLFYVPNIFNLNSTLESNKELRIYPSREIQAINQFLIYDRWGTNLVNLQNINPTNYITVWDGRIKNSDAPAAVYAYKLIFTLADGSTRIQYGDITLIR